VQAHRALAVFEPCHEVHRYAEQASSIKDLLQLVEEQVPGLSFNHLRRKRLVCHQFATNDR